MSPHHVPSSLFSATLIAINLPLKRCKIFENLCLGGSQPKKCSDFWVFEQDLECIKSKISLPLRKLV